MRTFLRILSYGKPYSRTLPQYIVVTFLHTIFSVVNISILIPIFQVLFEEQTITVTQEPNFNFSIGYFQELFYFHFGNVILQEGRLAALYFVTGVVVASFLMSNLFGVLSDLITAMVRIKVISNLRTAAFEKVSRFDMSYFTAQRKGDLVSRITTDVQQIESTVVGALKALIKEPLLIIGYFVVLFRMSVELTLYTLAIIPLSGASISYITKRLRHKARMAQGALADMTSNLDETISGIRIVKAFAARTYVVRKFREEVDKYARHNFKMSVRHSFAHPISQFFGVLVLALILLIGGSMVLTADPTLSGSTFIGFLVIFSQVLNPAKSFSNAISNIQRGLVSAERIFELVDATPKIENKANARPVDGFSKGFSFENVSFSYDQKPVLTNISFEIPKGKIIALVGPSGAGKSTIADLLPRFYDVSEGSIHLDGINIKDLDLDGLRRLMGVVTQESILFHDTVFKNIAFGKPEATLEEVQAAAKVANAFEFIEELESGFETVIGERGTKLSGGQRQRISIARAVLKNPPILVLDEATSSLDSKSEKLVQDAIFRLMENRTTLVIAHRLSTIQKASEILVVEGGKIVQRGIHENLMLEDGLYRHLTEMQSFDVATH